MGNSGNTPKRRPKDPWSNLDVHQLMLEDRVRTSSYRKAIEKNVKPHDVVLDLGCGTGILSFFAARKGCRRVWAVDKSSIIAEARETAERNGLARKIRFVRADIRKLRLAEKVDVLVQEQIGAFLWNEDMVSKVRYARERLLKKNGTLLPLKVDLYFAPSSHRPEAEKKLSFWSKKIYRLDFSPFKKKVLLDNLSCLARPHLVRLPDTRSFLAKEKLVYSMDLRKENGLPSKIEASFRIRKRSRLYGFCGFFKVHLDPTHRFSTRPRKTPNAWGQIFLPLFKAKTVAKNSRVRLSLSPHTNPNRWKFSTQILD